MQAGKHAGNQNAVASSRQHAGRQQALRTESKQQAACSRQHPREAGREAGRQASEQTGKRAGYAGRKAAVVGSRQADSR